VVDEGKDSRLEVWIAELGNQRIRYFPVEGEKETAGHAAEIFRLNTPRGKYIAIWDDDDLYHP